MLCDCHSRCAYTSTINAASHDNHEKINPWVSFSFLYDYGAAIGGPSAKKYFLKQINTTMTDASGLVCLLLAMTLAVV